MAITGSMWMLRGLCGCYRVYVDVTGLCGCYRAMWMLQGYVDVTGSMWLLQGLHGCYRSMFCTLSRKYLAWLLRDRFIFVKVEVGCIGELVYRYFQYFFFTEYSVKKKGAYRTHRFSVISVIPAKYRLLFSVISVIPAKYRLLFSVISVIPAIIFGNTGNTSSPTVASMCDLLRIQKPVYRYLPVFFSSILKTVLGRYRYSLGGRCDHSIMQTCTPTEW